MSHNGKMLLYNIITYTLYSNTDIYTRSENILNRVGVLSFKKTTKKNLFYFT